MKAYEKKKYMKPYSEILDQIILIAASGIKAIDGSEFAYKASPEKWSKKEILGHLIDSAYNNHQRFLRAEEQGHLVFSGYDQVDWVKKNNYQNRERDELVDTWVCVNRHLSFLIAAIPEKILLKENKEHNFHNICMNLITAEEPSTLSYLIWDYLFHLEHHLAQIIPGYRKINALSYF